ncbi:DUF551 domain-containing protein [Escherichia coli]|uniref:DUF551 domain-containing protein n=1 Tax=Escherichia coli TaxID=562 RepID=UPI0023DB24B8|nr:DUF551 domain-containing protein [Escherichia coli]WEN29729.1 DUF551 domain-containing protein [Escherichia coli]
MSNIDKHAVQAIADLKAGYTLGHADVAILNELARIALASLEAEAVADVVAWSSPNEERTCDIRMRRHDIKPGSLYTAPPAPEFYKIGDATMRHIFTPAVITDVSDMQAVFDQIETVLAGMWQPAPVSVPDELTREEYKRRFMEDDSFDDTFRGGWNACRAAMLHGAEPVSQTYKLNQLSGNSPVTPDGWISCSERTPNDAQWCVVNTKYGYYVQCWSEGQGWLGDDISIPECDVINWMPLPEPPQEVNRG